MAKYPDEIVRNGLPFDFVSSHTTKIDAKVTVWELKDKSKENYWGFRSKKANIQTRIIKAKDGKYLVYSRQM